MAGLKKNYGLVFKYKKLWLSIFDEYGNPCDAYEIDDKNHNYEDLTPWKMVVVSVICPQQDVYYLQILHWVDIENEEESTKHIGDLLESGQFANLARIIYERLDEELLENSGGESFS